MHRLFILPILVLASCSALEGEQKSNVNEIIKTQEIKQINKTDILVAAEKYGANIIELIKSQSIDDSLCMLNAKNTHPYIDSLSRSMNGSISMGFDTKDFASDQEKLLFEAYQYNEQNDINSESAVQFDDDNTVLYTFPEICDMQVDTVRRIGMWSIKIPVKTIVNSL